MSEIIKVDGLVKRYKELIAVDNFSMTVNEGEILGLLGPNGSGKSTTINCILSLLEYDKGTITIHGKEMSPKAYDLKRQIGVVPQEVSVFEELTVYENIDFFCGLYIEDKEERKKRVQEAIDFVELNDFKKFRPKKLSGGLKRRLNIACGIAHKPKIIFFDEPTVAVDPQSRNKILEGIEQLRKEGATVIYTSHYMEEVEQIADRIIIIDKGQLIAQGTVDELKSMIKKSEIIRIEAKGISDEDVEKIRKLDNVFGVDYDGKILRIEAGNGNNVVKVITLLQEKGYRIKNVYSEQPTLNDVFLELTGKELRDD
ncbi:MAG TPA: ABC transporter ATP-binding protein [Clostridiales bacterium]|nr:ABC transporter ATP-binding protein [Saccharofermentanaceae bacterium]HBY32450.1 ABC transporter ATP-binding protein [Clostridiales bacterium]HBZ77947.1 ABC transporter ATP-binding protein [Clostridiales bacterium]